MKDQLTQYFKSFAENAIQRMKAAILAISFYERIRARLHNGEDLSGEIAIIKKVGAAGTLDVVNKAIADYTQQRDEAWALDPRLLQIGKYSCKLVTNDREHLPRATLSYKFTSNAGSVTVNITSAGETFRLDIITPKNPMAASVARTELEKNLTFIALTR
jgi:hypothetical protein